MNKIRTYISTLLFLFMASAVQAQIVGTITDAETGDTILYPSVKYKTPRLAVSGNAQGYYSIARHVGSQLSFSAMGYKTKTITVKNSTPKVLNIKLRQDTKMLKEVEIKGKRGKYKRKENPAVALMKRVIAAKKQTKLTNHDYYRYSKYQKLMLAMNDIRPQDIDSGFFKNKPVLVSQIERSPVNDKLVFPISVDETVSEEIYRKDPKAEKTIIKAQQSTGLNNLFQIGEILSVGLKDVFSDVDIYDDQIRLLQYRFLSPIANSATSFYRYYIEDTVYVDKDLCYHLQFLPNNQQDFGFRGELYILADSTLHVKRCTLTIPRRSDVNFVENLQVKQEYIQLDNGEWVLSVDDMIVEMAITDFLSKAMVVRNTRMSDYRFDEIPQRDFRGKGPIRLERDALTKTKDYWTANRKVPLTRSEADMGDFLHRLRDQKGFKYIMLFVKAFMENFIETGNEEHPSKVDIGPVNTMISTNFIDGLRTRFSARTTANFSPHLFLSGYVARGWNSKKNYYRGEITWSFNHKQWMPLEYPKRTLSFSSSYDVMAPTDKFLPTDKDNVFTVLKWTKVDKMMFYNRQHLAFEWEERNGFRTMMSIRREENEASGNLYYTRLADLGTTFEEQNARLAELQLERSALDYKRQLHNGKMTNTELHAEFEYAPNRTYVHSKQKRRAVNNDAPMFMIGHTMGVKGLMGGQYNYNLTELSIYNRVWLHSWGNIDTYINAGAQWNQVPYPLLIMPKANLSYVVEEQMFNLINGMEFLNDRFASVDVTWDLNGKLLNRIPLFNRLKWREVFGVKCLWGDLTDKNNPFLPYNASSQVLMAFPEGSYVMKTSRPYIEVVAGIHNIFKLFHVQYVRRLTYNDLPTAHKNGIRVMMRISF